MSPSWSWPGAFCFGLWCWVWCVVAMADGLDVVLEPGLGSHERLRIAELCVRGIEDEMDRGGWERLRSHRARVEVC
mgnify:CR=1 FL=1